MRKTAFWALHPPWGSTCFLAADPTAKNSLIRVLGALGRPEILPSEKRDFHGSGWTKEGWSHLTYVLMEEKLHHLECINPVNDGMTYL